MMFCKYIKNFYLNVSQKVWIVEYYKLHTYVCVWDEYINLYSI